MYTCLECATKLVLEKRLAEGNLIFFKYALSISYGACEFCLKQKETVDFHHSIMEPINTQNDK
jgi:hypothetical protein